MVKLPTKKPNPHRQRSQLYNQILHLGHRQISRNPIPSLPVRLRLITQNLTATAAYQLQQLRCKLTGSNNLHRCDWFQQSRITLRHPLLHRQTRRLLKRLFRTIHRMVRSIRQRHLHIHHRETEGAMYQILSHPSLNPWYILFRYSTTHNSFIESKTLPTR